MKVSVTFADGVPTFEDEHVVAEHTRSDGVVYMELREVRSLTMGDPVPVLRFKTGEVYAGKPFDIVSVTDSSR